SPITVTRPAFGAQTAKEVPVTPSTVTTCAPSLSYKRTCVPSLKKWRSFSPKRRGSERRGIIIFLTAHPTFRGYARSRGGEYEPSQGGCSIRNLIHRPPFPVYTRRAAPVILLTSGEETAHGWRRLGSSSKTRRRPTGATGGPTVRGRYGYHSE